MGLSAAAKVSLDGENKMIDIMKFFEVGPGEFKEFWESLTEEEKDEFRKSKLS